MKKILVLFSILVLITGIVKAQDKPAGSIQVKPDDVKWVDAPPPLPPGSKLAVLEGNPKSDGLFTIRAMFPPYFKIPVHSHPKDERVTVISGVVYVGFGEIFDSTKATEFIEGSYYLNPAESEHYVFSGKEGCVLQITGIGPWVVNYSENEKK